MTTQTQHVPHDKAAANTFLLASECFSLALGHALLGLASAHDPLRALSAYRVEQEQRLAELEDAGRILRQRVEAWLARKGRHLPDTLKLRILAFQQHHRLGLRETARRLALVPSTLLRWTRRTGRLNDIRKAPPRQRIQEPVREMARNLATAGLGKKLIHALLLRAGIKTSRRSVGRFRKEKPGRPGARSTTPQPVRDRARTGLTALGQSLKLFHQGLRDTDPFARALARLRDQLHIALARRVAQARETDDPRAYLQAQIDTLHAALERALEETAILQELVALAEARRRPRYSPELRFDVLAHKLRYRLSARETARRFVLCTTTISEWLHELDPSAHTNRPRVRPRQALSSIKDVITAMTSLLQAAGVAHQPAAERLVHLGRQVYDACQAIPRRRRARKSPPHAGQTPAPRIRRPHGRSIRPRYENHIVSIDITDIRTFWRLRRLKLAVILDLYSRLPLAWDTYDKEPTATQMIALLQKACDTHGAPPHLISDQGKQFTAQRFRRAAKRLGIRQRFGAVQKYGSLAVIERFWKTLKEALALKDHRPVGAADARQRITLAMLWYARLRPHTSLRSATPAEIYHRLPPPALDAVRAPREYQGPDQPLPFEIRFLDPHRNLLPYLAKRAA